MQNKIFIGTPCFEYKVNANYVKTLLEFEKLGIDFEPFFLHDSLITRARNELITQFYENSTFTHLFWLDGDVSIPGEGLQTLLSHQVDVIATPVPIKDLNPGAHQSIRRTYEEIKPYLYKAEAAASTDLQINTFCTEFIALIADAKFGEPNVPAIQTSLTQIISSVEFSIEDLAEIQALFTVTGLNQIYTLG